MDNIYIEESEIRDYIVDTLYSVKTESEEINNARYHHNTSYKCAPLVCKHGILSLTELNRLGIRNDPLEQLEKMGDTESHVNGSDGISLSVTGLDDLYADEEEYDPLDSSVVDFVISDDIKAHRSSIHYGNEFICYGSISIDKIASLDFRILEHIKAADRKNVSNEDLIIMYNSLLKSAKNLKITKSNIFLREMSFNDPFHIDVDTFASLKRIAFRRK